MEHYIRAGPGIDVIALAFVAVHKIVGTLGRSVETEDPTSIAELTGQIKSGIVYVLGDDTPFGTFKSTRKRAEIPNYLHQLLELEYSKINAKSEIQNFHIHQNWKEVLLSHNFLLPDRANFGQNIDTLSLTKS